MYIFIIFLVLIILLQVFTKKEHFNRDYYPRIRYNFKDENSGGKTILDKTSFTPINMIVNPVKVNGIDNNLKLDADAIKDAILRIDTESLSPNDIFTELDTTNINKSLDNTKSIANNCLVGVLTF